MSEEMLTPKAVAELLGIHEGTLVRWRQQGHGPPTIQTGPRVYRYPRAQFDQWVAAGGDRAAAAEVEEAEAEEGGEQ